MQYYTLREAAEKLGMDPDKLKDMAKANQLRAFQDRGTLRFRAQEIDELARSLGLGSDPELQIREQLKPSSKPASGPPKSPPPASGKSPPPTSGKSPPPSSRRTMHVPADADLSLVGDEHDAVPIGNEPTSGKGSKPPSSKSKPSSKKSGGPASPSPVPAHDSDVRLVSDSGELDFPLEGEEGKVAQKPPSSGPKSPKDAKKRPTKTGPEGKPDSGVRIVPLDKASDSDVKIVPDERGEPDSNVPLGQAKAKTPSDSDVRLELTGHPPAGRGTQDPFVTEELELDLEALKQEESKTKRRKPKKSNPELPTTSPFELAEEESSDEQPKLGQRALKEDSDTDSSSDFELTPASSSSGQLPIELGSDELPIPLAKNEDSDDAQVVLGETSGPGKHDSGINLADPKDSGISLEEGGSDEIEFEPSPDATATPKPGPATPKPKARAQDSSGEFELSLDDSPVGEEEHTSSEFELTLDHSAAEEAEDSSSEFELSLDPNATSESSSESEVEGDSSPVDSDSEFELSLDASGELEAESESGLTEGEKDIFETDFEVPALDEESGSEAVALDEESDTDLEGSDFELDLSDEDLATDEESGSQVVALEEDEEAAEEEPRSRKPRKKAAAVAEPDEPLIDLEQMEEEEAEPEEETAVGAAAPAPAPPAQWGVLPAIFLVPSFVVLFFVVIMSFEMLSTMWGYHTGGVGARMIIDPLARTWDKTIP
jgi:excisionase family DNA binding protein